MSAESIEDVVRQAQHWKECGARLGAILAEIASRIGDAPVYFDETGEFFAHSEVLRILKEPGNEELYDFFLYMQRASVAEAKLEGVQSLDFETLLDEVDGTR